MLDQNTDRGSWAMIALVVAGVALLLVKAGSNEIGQLILDNIKVTDSDTVVVIRDGEKQTI